MCGIAGLMSMGGSTGVSTRDLERMCTQIVHRGPDAQGTYVRDNVALGMRRLSIIDLVSGDQPVYNEDRTIAVVYNGEIYNYRELRSELEQMGHQFYTNSDTEVIPHLYEQLGMDFPKKLRGMFAIAVHDSRNGRLLLVRDRLGKKPLVYAHYRDRLVFASEMRALLVVEPGLAEVDDSALLRYLEIGYFYDPDTAFQKIRRLPAGHMLECKNGAIRIWKYWEIPPFLEENSKSENEWLDALEQELASAVRMRLVSDVPVGAMLSGGVDSSLVTALMARASGKQVKTFSVTFENELFNEGPYARRVAEQFGTEHHELAMRADVPETIEQLTRLLEEPFGDSSMLPTYLIARLVRQHVTVALSGDGGDELFAGYDRYDAYLRRNRFRIVPEVAGRVFRRKVFPLLPWGATGRRFLYNITLPFAEGYVDAVSVLPSEREQSLYTEEFLAAAGAQETTQAAFARICRQVSSANPLGTLQYLDMKTYLGADILPKVDRMSMAASLETRAPLLDHVFLELVNRVPAHYKLKNGEGKYLLKKLAERCGVPRQAIHRPKRGFAVPLVHWFRNELKELLMDVLTDRRSLQRGYFKLGGIQALLDDHMRGRDRSRELWVLLMLELWHRNFLEPLRAGSVFSASWQEPPATRVDHPTAAQNTHRDNC